MILWPDLKHIIAKEVKVSDADRRCVDSLSATGGKQLLVMLTALEIYKIRREKLPALV